ncbi:DUF3397 domain-containing protein [Streptococcus sobrinus]|uniref:DUF3397 domain-containing protein n=1 Tax=Streptococcus sobrinus TaxID=1310 RepID=UPI00030B03AC|nr:DUF3397 domain-containing protein [Streptococcus sobrinus]
MIYIFAVLYFFIIPFLAQSLVRYFVLKRFSIKFPDLSLPFLAVAIIYISGRYFTHNFFPQYLLMMCMLAIATCLFILRKAGKIRIFSYKRFFKLFWRMGYLLTAIFYIVTIVLIALR